MESQRQLTGASDFVLTVLLCLGAAVEFQVVGAVFIHELLLPVVVAAHLLRKGDLQLPRPLAILLGLCLIAIVAQVTSDFLNETAMRDALRGWARLLFFASNATGIYLLAERSLTYLRTILVSLAIAITLGIFLFPSPLEAANPWKFGVGLPWLLVTALVSGQLTRAGRKTLATGILLLFGLISLFLDSRLLAALAILAAMHPLAIATSELADKRRAAVAYFSIPFAALSSVGIFMSVYRYAATHGLLGIQAGRRFESQMNGTLGLLLGARREIYASAQAILDRPLLGHGSWARGADYVLLLSELERFGYTVVLPDNDFIPTHSHLFGAWVEGGALATLPWLFLLGLAAKVGFSAYSNGDKLSTVALVASTQLAWDILFSPLGSRTRTLDALTIVICLFYLQFRNHTSPSQRPQKYPSRPS